MRLATLHVMTGKTGQKGFSENLNRPEILFLARSMLVLARPYNRRHLYVGYMNTRL